MNLIRLSATAVLLGAATFVATALILGDGARGPERAAALRAGDEAALVVRLKAALEEPPAATRLSPAEARRIGAAAAGAPAPVEAAAPSESATGIAAPADAPVPIPVAAAAPATADPEPAADSEPAPARFALDPAGAAIGSGWVAASGEGPIVFEIRPLPRRP